MITNKYESPPDYQKRKQQRLRQIQEDYFPPPPDTFFSKLFQNRPVYIPCENYTNNHQPSSIPLHINYSRTSNYLLIAMALIVGAWPYLLKPENINSDNVFGSIIILSIMVGAALKKLLYRKPLMVLSEQSFLFNQAHLAIAWEHVIAAHVLEENDGEGTSYYFVIDYYDVYEDYFKVHRFAANGYDISYQEIAVTIAHCLKKAVSPQTDIQKITNLPLQTV